MALLTCDACDQKGLRFGMNQVYEGRKKEGDRLLKESLSNAFRRIGDYLEWFYRNLCSNVRNLCLASLSPDRNKADGLIGARELMKRFYCRRPTCPSPLAIVRALSVSLASRRTVRPKERKMRVKAPKQRNRSGVDAMRSKIGMKSNVIRKLPRNIMGYSCPI
ncbi:hypothetical protein QJS04_geneDACA013920 [Acorus gramineus]|uniref:Uncharacterized protein n=1 Tax=Acorus gramineus TaxID=55184 RepID=A0AAV9AY10_ACOGR|nr:hypothetical protein QJS04_geneDACA013920 [Acorus gramineus]